MKLKKGKPMNLKPCAQCGSKKVSLIIDMTKCYKITCLGCSISTTSFNKITLAVKSWNRRYGYEENEKELKKWFKYYNEIKDEYPYM